MKFPSPNFSSFYFTWSEDFSVNVMKYMHISLRENRLTLKYFAGWPYDLEYLYLKKANLYEPYILMRNVLPINLRDLFKTLKHEVTGIFLLTFNNRFSYWL